MLSALLYVIKHSFTICCPRRVRVINYKKSVQPIVDQCKHNAAKEEMICLNSGDISGTLFREKQINPKQRLDLSPLNGVVGFDPINNTLEVGGKTTFYDVVRFTLPLGFAPQVVPELISITVGGAICGVGIESSSINYGLVHDTVTQFELLLPSGELILCTPDNEHSELFHALPNSYGTLGYITKATIKLVKTDRFVNITNYYPQTPTALFEMIQGLDKSAQFVEAIAFSKNKFVLSIGEFSSKPYTTLVDHTVPYYTVLNKAEQYSMLSYDYYWRWDADSFWGTIDHKLLQNRTLRKLLGRSVFNSVTFRFLSKLFPTSPNKERIVQDIGIPIEKSEEMFNWIDSKLTIYPLWICPVKTHKNHSCCWPLTDGRMYCDFGIFGTKVTGNYPKRYFNQILDEKMFQLEGGKCFYSDTYFSQTQYLQTVNGDLYKRLKDRYDPNAQLPNLYDKVVTPLPTAQTPQSFH